MLDQQTKRRIDDCRDILVGKITDPKSQVEQITIALIYKFMDDMDTESIEMGGLPTYFVGEYEKYSWKNVFNPRMSGYEVLELYGEGMVKMNQNPNLPQLFRDIFKNAYLPYRDPETLKLFLKNINEFKYDHSEKLGDAFEYLLSVLGSQGDAGQFRTPRHIIDFIVEIVVNPKKIETILDPACGTSGFLISSYKHILKSNTNKTLGDKLTPSEKKKLIESVTGYDISPDMVRLSLVNLFLHGFTNPKIYEYDTLTSEDKWNEYYDVILANPPFMSPKGGIRPHKRFGIQSNRSEVLFVDYIMEHLTPKGRAGIVVPEGIIFQSGTAYKSLRKTLVEKYLVGVISLPSGVFQPYSGVKTSILIIDKELTSKTDKIFFGRVENDGFDLGAQRREIDKNDLPIFTKEITEYLEGLRNVKDVKCDKLKFVTKDQILKSSDIGLSFDRYSKKELRISDYPLFELKELVDFKRGTSITKKQVTEGNIPVIAGGQTPAYYHNEYNRIGETITVSSSGAYSGFVNYFTTPIFASDCFTISPKEDVELLPKFLFHLLKLKQNEIYSRQVGGGQPHIYPKSFDGFEIPLPPIDVQEEIVRELEQYQKIIDGARQVVDNYKPVIDIDPSWEMKELGEVGKVSMCKRIFKDQTNVKNGVPFYKIGTFGGTPDSFIDFDLFKEYKSKYSYPRKGDILISTSGTIGKIVVFDGEPAYFQDSNIVWIKNDETIISNPYLKIIFQTIDWKPTEGVTIPRLYNKNIEETKVHCPPLEIQQLIVERIESERQIIEGNKKLIQIYTQKIQDRINKIWGN